MTLKLAYNKNVSDPEIPSTFFFSEKGLEKVSPPYFVYDFSRKMLLMLYTIN